VFDANSFMIAASSNVSFDVERGADGLKDTVLESAVIVNDNQTAEADRQKHFFLYEETSKFMGGDSVSDIGEDER
jgi:hypothetical protein